MRALAAASRRRSDVRRRSVADGGDRLGRNHRCIGATSWSLGLGVAEAMDTAQRGTGLDLAQCVRS